MLFDGDFTLTDQIVDSHECRRENLIGMMQDVQEHYKYLPPEVLVHLAGRLHISPGKVYSVATFYDRFSLEAKGSTFCVCATAPPATCANRSPFSKRCRSISG